MWGILVLFFLNFCNINLQEQLYFGLAPIPIYPVPIPIQEVPYQINQKVLNNIQTKQQQQQQQTFTIGSCRIEINRQCPDSEVSFYLYTRKFSIDPELISVGPTTNVSNLYQSAFNPKLPTKIIVHGYNSDMHLHVLDELRKQYFLAPFDFNLFTVDWGPLSQGPCYPAAVWNARHVGRCTAQLVQRIREFGNEDIHVLGFSLGAHVTNFMATSLRPFKVSRITGLDPAMPGFITVGIDDKLDKTDAEFVDVIHTNAFIQGKVEESGHVDFYINGGVIQPGCWAENRFFACNHHRAPLYFAETINTKLGFWGWPCRSYLEYLLGRCPPRDPQIIMGEHISTSSNGVYLVITESVSPYAVGKYDGPAIEILFKSDMNRLHILKKFRKEVTNYVDEDAIVETLYNVNKKYGTKIENDPIFELEESFLDDFYKSSPRNFTDLTELYFS